MNPRIVFWSSAAIFTAIGYALSFTYEEDATDRLWVHHPMLAIDVVLPSRYVLALTGFGVGLVVGACAVKCMK